MGQSNSNPVLSTMSQVLLTKEVPLTDDAFWDSLWSFPDSLDQIWALFSLEYVRKLKRQAPYNLKSLVQKAIIQLRRTVVLGNLEPTDPQANATVLLEMFKKTLATVRILTRVMSVVLEDQSDGFCHYALWSPVTAPPQPQPTVAPPTSTTTLDNDAVPSESKTELSPTQSAHTELAAVPTPSTPTSPTQTPPPTLPSHPLAVQLVHLLTELLFVPGFTIVQASSNHTEHGVHLGKLWTSSVYQSRGNMDGNRTEVLRCLLVCFSEGVFVPPELYRHGDNHWLSAMCSPRHKLAPTLFYSLLNTICGYEPVGMLPYSHMLFSDYREPLVDISLQLLLVLLDHRDLSDLYLGHTGSASNPQSTEAISTQPAQTLDTEAKGDKHPVVDAPPAHAPPIADVVHTDTQRPKLRNIFRDCFLSIGKEDHLAVIYDGLTRLLNNAPDAYSTNLPGSAKRIDCYQEIFVLIWKLLDENEHFFRFLVHRADVLKLVHPLLYFMFESKQDPSKVGLMYTSVFILLRLSGSRDFSVALNRPYTTRLPCAGLPNKIATYADLLVIVCHKLIVSSPDHLDALLNVVLTVLSNVSPYLTHLDLSSSVKLLNLFELFSSPKFLYANDSNHQYIFLLLDIFNNIIQYQYQGNSKLVYAICRRAKLFYRLGRIPSIPVPPSLESKPEDSAGALSASLSTDSNTSAEVKVEAATAAASQDPATRGQPHLKHPTNKSFTPTPEWAMEWKRKLPLEPIFRLLEFFLPKVEALCNTELQVDETRFLDLIQKTTLVGVLPVPHSIIVRRYIPNAYTNMWFTTYVWGVIFLRNQAHPLFDGSKIRMFVICLPSGHDEAAAVPPASSAEEHAELQVAEDEKMHDLTAPATQSQPQAAASSVTVLATSAAPVSDTPTATASATTVGPSSQPATQ